MSGEQAAGTAAAAARMETAAVALLSALDPDQRSRVSFDFPAEGERRRWFYTPTDHGGLALAQMRPVQRQRTLQLVASGLSLSGYNTAATIMGLENILDREEGWDSRFYRDRGSDSRGRDPQLYFVSVFGNPGADAAWGWRFGGHHISLSFTIVDGVLAARTPTFFGANPSRSPLGGGAILQPLAGEEDLGRALVRSLDDGQRRAAVLAPIAPWDLMSANRAAVFQSEEPPSRSEIFRESSESTSMMRPADAQRRSDAGTRVEYLDALRLSLQPKGIAAGSLNQEQRGTLAALLAQYLQRLPDELAGPESARLTGAMLEQVHFAWAGSLEPREPHYYRLQGPRLFIEYDNTQNGANHVHSVWRDPEGDFGDDVLRRHLVEAHS